MARTLDTLGIGESAAVLRLTAEDGMRRRLASMGFVAGQRVTCLMRSFLGDPAAYRILGAVVALRRGDARKILII